MADETRNSESIRILPIERAEDFVQAYDCEAAAFGTQIADGLWITSHPGWDDPDNKDGFVENRIERWKTTTKDESGRPNAVFLKAVVDKDGGEVIVGHAVWVQASADQGHGDAPLDEAQHLALSQKVYPDDEAEARFLTQARASLQQYRRVVAKEKSGTAQPAWFILDLCAVHPDYQGRGLAKKLVQWGLDEAKARGGLECTTEASIMGRRVYEKLGFVPGPEIEYVVDAEFAERKNPSNQFMRTGGFGL